jgi:hypothetical protein
MVTDQFLRYQEWLELADYCLFAEAQIVGMMQENRCLALFALVAKWKNAGVRLEALGRFATAKTRTPDGGQAFC